MKSKVLRIFLCLAMCLSLSPTVAFAETVNSDGQAVTKDLGPLLTNVELSGVSKDENGKYYVSANKPYSISLVFAENSALELDMTDTVHFRLPDGVVAPNGANRINIGVVDGGLKPIYHAYTIHDNILTITWNKKSEFFDDLARSHNVSFTFNIQAEFDGSQSEVRFGDLNKTSVNVDNTGSVTVNKTISGLASNVTLSDEQKRAMTFELRDANGKVIKSFSYADMDNGSLTFSKLAPGSYTVVETGKPSINEHTFDPNNSTESQTGTLAPCGNLELALTNDYERDTGSLELSKAISCTNWDGSTTIPNSVKKGISFTITGPEGYSRTVPYTDFTNGKMLLTGLVLGEYTITETNSVTGYTCTYTVNNAKVDDPTAKATVKKDETATASFGNTYVQQTGSLTIEKTASGATVPANTEFTVTFPDRTTTRTFKYSDMTNGSYTLSNIPLGTYTVDEKNDTANVANYSLEVTGEGTVRLSDNSKDKTVAIKNVYTPLGSIKINKSISGIANMTDAQKRAIKFTVYDSSGKSVGTLTYADFKNGSYTMSNLPVGEYTVKETGSSISGYSVVTSPANAQMKVTVTVGQTAEASFKNTYTKDEYKLAVKKTFGDGSAYTSDNLPDSVKNGTTFTITKEGGTAVASFTYAELNAGLKELVLDGPGPYIITETNPSLDGYSISTSVTADKVASNSGEGNSIKVTLKIHEQATVTFENTYTPQGKITGDKNITGLTPYYEQALKGDIRFDIYKKGADGKSTLYKGDVTLDELKNGITVPVGNYYVKEKNATVTGYNGPSASVQVDNGTVKNNSTESDAFEVKHNGTVTVIFSNAYTPADKGNISLEKTVSGLNDTNENTVLGNIEFKLEQKIDNAWHTVGTYKLNQISAGIDVLPGTYRLTESGGELDGYAHFISYVITTNGTSGTTQTSNPATFTVDKNAVIEISVTNTYAELGNLTITKTITGDLVTKYPSALDENLRKSITFTVAGPHGFSETFSYNDIVSSDNNATGTKTFSNIPVGTYTVTENASGTDLFNLTVTPGSSKATATVATGATAQIAFTNEYNHKLGNLTIHKTMAGDAPTSFTEEQMKAMSFSVKNSSGNEVCSVTYDQFTNGSYTVENLPIGQYSVVETIGNVFEGSYTVTASYSAASVAVTDTVTAEVTVTNTFEKIGALQLVKTFSGAKISDTEKASLQFEYRRVDANGNAIANSGGTVSYADFKDGSYTINNLPLGKYRVTELNTDTGYKRTVSVQVDGAAATEGNTAETNVAFKQTSTVTFNNDYEEIAAIVITKNFAGDLGAAQLTEDQRKAIKFRVSNGAGKSISEFTYNDMSNGSMTINNLAPGSYTVTETIDDQSDALFGKYAQVTSYTVGSAEAAQGTVAAVEAVHGQNAVTFTNTFTTIPPLKVEKNSSKTWVGMANINGIRYPVWRFVLNIENINPLTTTGGTTTFTDVFDATHASWFRLATSDEVASALKLDAGDEKAKNYYITSLVEGKAAPQADFRENQNGSNTITISGITNDTADKCTFTYYLIVKDKETLLAINTPSSQNASGVALTFKNTVTYQPMPTSYDTATVDSDYEYKFSAVDKQITNLDEKNNLYDTFDNEKVFVDYADYAIKLNENGVSIGNQPTIIATDTFSSNQTVLLSSIRTNPSEGVSYTLDNNEHKIVFTIPNGTPVEVFYRTIVNDKHNAQVQLVNKIDLLGFTDGVDMMVNQSLGGEGQGEVFSASLIKVDSLNNSIKLKGVEFELHDGKTGALLTTAVTNEAGLANFKYWGENGSFKLDYDYYLVEKSAATGYNLKTEPIKLRISKTEAPGLKADGVNVINSGGELIVTNEPVTATLSVTKSFNNWGKQDSFSFKLEPLDGAPMPAAGGETATAIADDPETAINESTATFGTIRYNVSDADFANGATVSYQYTIQEVVTNPILGITYDTAEHKVTVTISDDGNDGVKEVAVSYDQGKNDLTITNTYSEGSLTVAKALAGNDVDYTKDFSFTVTLNPALSGTYSGVEFVNGVATIVLKGGQSKTIDGLPNGVEYVVTEADYTGDGYVTTMTGQTGAIAGYQTKTAAFTNTRNTYGDLSVTKSVEGNAGDENKQFDFTVELSDTSISGTFGDMTFENGIASFTLKHDETKVAKGLPNGVEYVVTEADYTEGGYVTVKTGETGVIVGNEAQAATFTNTRNAEGSLTVAKTLEGNDVEVDKEFTFVITLSPAISGIYSDVEFVEGVATVVLKGGESKTIEGLPNRTAYTVVELEANEDGYETTSVCAEGAISETEVAVASFTNTRNSYGDLVVTKSVKGNAGDKNKEFNFVVELSDKSVFGEYGDMLFVNGVATFTLKHGEDKVAKGLPNGVEYLVIESDYTSEGYTTEMTGDAGLIVGDETCTASFINTKNKPPKTLVQTGDGSHLFLWAAALLVSGASLAGASVYGKRRKQR